MNITNEQIDALKEMINIGVGSGAFNACLGTEKV